MRTVHLFCWIAACCLLSACSSYLAVKKADKAYAYGEYDAAATLYGKAYRVLSSGEKALRASVSFSRGECFRLLNIPLKAESEYRKALKYNYPNDTVYLRLGQTLHKNGKYEEAATHYNRFLDSHPEDLLALNGAYACNRIKVWSAKRPVYQVKKANDLFTKKGNFSPILIPQDYNTLLFNSSGKVKKDIKPSRITGLPDNDFWISTKGVDGKWMRPQYIEGPINSEFDEGTGSVTGDGKTLYFTRCVTKSDSIQTFSKVEIYKSVRSGAEWSEPQKVVLHRDSSILFAHPAITSDGRFLYFVSDLKGGFGGKDIWRCELGQNTVGAPENLGPLVNTPGDEVFPTLRTDSTLYFSSDGQPGFGGLDLFVANLKQGIINRVENMGMPLNSQGDDFGLTFYGKEERGYFSSNRKESKGWDQLWSFEQAKTAILVRGTVRDNFGEVVPDATIRLINDKGLNTKIRTNKDGTYQASIDKGAEYALLGTARSYLNNSNRFYALDREKDTSYQVDFSLTPLYRPVRIDNIFFDFNKATLTEASLPALEGLHKLLLDNPHILVEIGAHTDRIGTESFNNALSEQRAQSVVNYLVEQGIEKDRLIAKGYGKSQPVKVDSRLEQMYRFLKEDTYLDEGYINTLTPEQQEIADQINRRSEFKVLKTTYKLF
jgi:peptidoglycan-associated lipoprotein